MKHIETEKLIDLANKESLAKQKIYEAVSCALLLGVELLNRKGPDAEIEEMVKRINEIYIELRTKKWRKGMS